MFRFPVADLVFADFGEACALRVRFVLPVAFGFVYRCAGVCGRRVLLLRFVLSLGHLRFALWFDDAAGRSLLVAAANLKECGGAFLAGGKKRIAVETVTDGLALKAFAEINRDGRGVPDVVE